MARMARSCVKVEGESATYHLYGRVACNKGEYPLAKGWCRKVLIETIKRYSQLYSGEVLAFTTVGTHYHLVMRFDAFQKLTDEELWERALAFYPNSEKELSFWTNDKWERFNKRLFDVSEFMRNVHSSFATAYNHKFEHHGRFWADRFKCTLLENDQAVLDAMLYVELNPVRAGLVVRPEDWKGSSLFYREAGLDDWMMPLSDFFEKTPYEALKEYRCLVYYRGEVPTKPGQSAIPKRIIQEEESRGFNVSGIYKKRFRHFVDGLIIGGSDFIQEKINQFREQGTYQRRKHPIPQLEGLHQSVREQRNTVVGF